MAQMETHTLPSRRDFCRRASCSLATFAASPAVLRGQSPGGVEPNDPFTLNYILASPLYGMAPLAEVLAEASKISADAIDIWPRPHANHREQIDELGVERTKALLESHKMQLGAMTRYDLGPYRLTQEIPLLSQLGGTLLVCGAVNQSGKTVKDRVRRFVESLKPHVAEAQKRQITIGIENHSRSLLASPDALRYFADFISTKHLGLALAPYHLPQDPELIAELIEHFGEKLVFFQAWQHGKGCTLPLPREEQLLQLPGRGPLDFRPILAALQRINYQGWTEIFMHPVPRGVPILPSTAEVTAEINRAQSYLQDCLRN